MTSCGCTCHVCMGGYHIFCNVKPHGTEEEAERYFVEHPEVAKTVRPIGETGQKILDRALKKIAEKDSR